MSELVQAIELWRQSRHPDLPHVIRSLAKKEGPTPEPKAPSQRQGRGVTRVVQAEWIAKAVAVTPEGLGRLLATTTDGYAPHAVARLRALMEHGPDPRIADAAMNWCLQHVYVSRPRTDPWWVAIREVLTQWLPHDFSFADFAAEVWKPGSHETVNVVRLARWLARLTSTAPAPKTLDEVQQARLDAWLVAHPLPVRPPKRTALLPIERLTPLLDAVYDDPDAEAPRRVLLDRLTEAGDPWGRFLGLQLEKAAQGTPDAVVDSERRDETEEAQLLEEHGARWSGRSFHNIVRAYYERGFPVKAELHQRWSDLPKAFEEPGFATVRELALLDPDAKVPHKAWLSLLRSKRAQHLRTLIDLPVRVLAHLPTFAAVPDCVAFHLDAGAVPKGLAQALASVHRLEIVLADGPVDRLRSFAVSELQVRFSSERYPLAQVLANVSPTVTRFVAVDSDVQLLFVRDGEGVLRPTLIPDPKQAQAAVPLTWLAEMDTQHLSSIDRRVRYVLRDENPESLRLLETLPPGPLHVSYAGFVDDPAALIAAMPELPELSLDHIEDLVWLPLVEDAPQLQQVRCTGNGDWLVLERGSHGRFAIAHVGGPASNARSGPRQWLDVLWHRLARVQVDRASLARGSWFRDSPSPDGPEIVDAPFPMWPPS
ncbi:MAG: hypothetical protein AAGA48_14895 [Myxococcota bacterium]